MQYMSGKHLEFTSHVQEIYSDEFLEKIYGHLLIVNEEKKIAFRDYAIRNAVNFLDACEINTDRTPAFKQKKILEKYLIALKKTQSEFEKVGQCEALNFTFHKTLREKVKNASPEIEEMFAPYMQVKGEENDFWMSSENIFHQFLDVLIGAATDTPSNIEDDYKTDLTSEFIFEWVVWMEHGWSHFTHVNFGVADWIKSNDDEKGSYKSVCVDVLHDLLSAIDKKITRSHIETAIRKMK